MYCEICKKDIHMDNANFSAIHIKKYHNMSIQSYYDEYISTELNHTCNYCGKPTKFIGLTSGYRMYCSRSCTSKSPISKEKSKTTCVERYGVSSYSKTSTHRNMIQNQNKSESFKSKIRDTIKNRTDETKNQINEKRYTTNIIKYGHKHASQSSEVKKTALDNNKHKYGVVSTSQLSHVKNKAIETSYNKYNTKYPCQNTDVIDRIQETKRYNYYDNLVCKLKAKNIIPLMSKDEFTNKKYKFQCNHCKTKFTTDVSNAYSITCRKCSKNRSQYEQHIKEYIECIGITNIECNKFFYDNGKRKFELDIYLPDLDIGIEYCGLYYHSDFFRYPTYHQDKYKYFKSKNIKVIQIFESEWCNRQDIIKSIINHNLKHAATRIFARKCKFTSISISDYRKFLDLNHIQGYTSTLLKYGLKYNDQLVAVCGIGKSRYTKSTSHELVRFCVKLNTSVVGGFSKLVSNICNKHNIESLVSYSDLRYFDSHAYESFGFKFSHISKPNYFYYKSNTTILQSRLKFQKHKLNKILPVFDKNKTEYENLIINKYFRIHDAGNSVWIYNNPTYLNQSE